MKKTLSMLLALSMLFCLCACGKTDGKTTLNVIAAQYGQQTAHWWKTFEADFEKANTSIDLVIDVVSWNDIYTTVNTRVANNDAPDILNIDVFADYQADGLLLPAKEYVSEKTYEKFYPAFLEQSQIDGTVWAIPDLASARALYYNADILAEAGVEVPATWDELTAACQKILDHYKGAVYPWGVDMTTDEGQACFAYYIWNNGGGFVDENGNWTLNSEKNVEAVEYIMNMVKSGYTNTDPATETRYDNQDMFGAGKVAMMIGPNSIPAYLEAGKYEVNYGVAPIPTNSGTSVSAGVMDRFMCFDNDYSDEELSAIRTFFDFFYEDARYADWVLMEGFLPATVTGGELVAAADESLSAWVEIVGSSKFYPTAKTEWADVKQGVIHVLQQALLGGDVRQLLDQLQSEITG